MFHSYIKCTTFTILVIDNTNFQIGKVEGLCFFDVLVLGLTFCCFFQVQLFTKPHQLRWLVRNFRFSAMATLLTLSFQTIKFEYFSSVNWIWSRILVANILGSWELLADEYCRASCFSNAYHLHTTVTVQTFICVPSMDLLDIWHESTHGILKIFLFHLSALLTLCRLMNGFCSIWLTFSNRLSRF